MKQGAISMTYVSVLVAGLAAAACTTPNPDFCDSNDDCGGDVCNLDLNRCEPAFDASVGPDGAVVLDASPGADAPPADAGPETDGPVQRFRVTATVAGAGGGTVTSSPEGIDCGDTCSDEYEAGTEITLIAAADGLSTFEGWSGAGCSGTGACVFTLDADTAVTATFGQQAHVLTVTTSGDGTGAVTSAPTGIDCGADCSESFTAGAMVTLTATPTAPATFGGWSGACSGLTTTCDVTMDAARTVGAAFDLGTVSVSVSLAGTGGGSVNANVGAIDCPGTCADSYTVGTTVLLTASADATSSFTGWAGAGCSGMGDCSVSATAARSVTATFTRNTHTLTVARAGSGGGTVTSVTPDGIDCGSDCSEVYEEPTVVTLLASPNATSTFAGWSGACSGTALTCMVTMNDVQSATATFNLIQRTLTVSVTGTGTGTVTGTGINCPGDCSQQFDHGTTVSLTQAATSGFFTGWSGACSGTGVCAPAMTANRSVAANFDECRDSNDCSGTSPLCTAAECVACGSNAQCAGLDPAAPICDGGGACVPCIDHIQCDSGVCDLESGSCVDEGDIVYVDSGGSTTGGCGTAGLPCRTMTLGISHLTTSRTFMKLDSDTYSAEASTVVFDGITANVVAPGAILDQSTAGGILGLQVTNGAVVHIDSLEVRSASNTGIDVRSGSALTLLRATVRDNPIGINNFDSTLTLDQTLVTGGNLSVASACLSSPCEANLSVTRSTTTGTGNRGLQLSGGVFTVENSMIIDNDVASTSNPLIQIGGGATGIFSFTTIAGNDMGGSADGLRCDVDAGAVTVTNSIFYDNSFGDDAISGACLSWTYSNIENRVALGVTGTGNIDANPVYVNPGTGNYRIQSGSPARNAADPAATATVDFDGESRPEGIRADMGADEFHP